MQNVSTENARHQPTGTKVPSPVTAEQRTTARHEAGHATLAEVLHVPLESVSILATKGAAGHTQLAKKMRTANLATMPTAKRIDLATRLCVVCLGGAASLNVIENNPDWPSAEEDMTVYNSLIPYCGIRQGEDRAFFFRVYARAAMLIHQYRGEVEAVANALLRRKTLDGDAVRGIVRQSGDGED